MHAYIAFHYKQEPTSSELKSLFPGMKKSFCLVNGSLEGVMDALFRNRDQESNKVSAFPVNMAWVNMALEGMVDTNQAMVAANQDIATNQSTQNAQHHERGMAQEKRAARQDDMIAGLLDHFKEQHREIQDQKRELQVERSELEVQQAKFDAVRDEKQQELKKLQEDRDEKQRELKELRDKYASGYNPVQFLVRRCGVSVSTLRQDSDGRLERRWVEQAPHCLKIPTEERKRCVKIEPEALQALFSIDAQERQ
ncbi:MAG: hypothetical protein SGARI_000595 [Bacillariaceae sp.]